MAPPSGSARPSSAAAVASAQRPAAIGSPESRASHARARHSRGSLVTTSGDSASSQRSTVAPRPLCREPFHDVATRSAAAAPRPAARRWPTAPETSPVSAHHAPARACSSAICSGGPSPRARGAGRRGRRGGSGTTRGARPVARGRGWRARSRLAAASSRPGRGRHRIAAREAVEDAGLDEEGTCLVVLRRDDLVAEVVDEMAVVAEVARARGAPAGRAARAPRGRARRPTPRCAR